MKNPKGCIQEKSGSFYLVISRGRNNPPKWAQLKATTLQDAEIERDDITTDRRRGVWTEPSKVTLEQFAGQFLRDMDRAVKRSRTAAATYEWYEKRIRLHINPVIGYLKLSEIRARDLQNLYDDLYEESTNKADAVYRILHRLWVVAMKDDDLDIRYNLAEKIDRGDKIDQPAVTWTGAQITEFLLEAKPRRYYEVFLLGFAAGMRLGEILGLSWPDIDHKNMIIHVRRSITLNKVYDMSSNQNLFKKTKTSSSIRDIRMIPAVSKALEALRKRQAVEQLKAKEWVKSDLVFTTDEGKPVNYSNLRENYWFKIIDFLGLPSMKLHGMRHSCATWLYEEMGVPLEVIQDILGHSSPLITKKLYVHAGVKAQDRAMGAVSDRFKEMGL